jgi:hypothetical protein
MVFLMLLLVTSPARAERPRRPGVAMTNAGTVLTIMGIGMTVAGGLMAMLPRWTYPGFFTCAPDEPCYLDVPAASVAGVGAGIASVGIPLWIVGAKKQGVLARHEVALSVMSGSHAGASTTSALLSLRF